MPAHGLTYEFRSIRDLSAPDIAQYLDLYRLVFGRPLSEERLWYKFTRQMGTDTHFVLMRDPEGRIVGSLGAIEVPYVFRGRRHAFALTVDAMIHPDHRVDMLAMKRQHDILIEALRARGVQGVFTKPNNNSYLYLKKLLGFADVGELHAHALPLRPLRALRPGWAAPALAWFDLPWLALLRMAGRLARPRGGFARVEVEALRPDPAPEAEAFLHRERDAAFLRDRYDTAPYHAVACGGAWVIYAISPYDGRHACFALETGRMRFGDWLAFARHVARAHREVDLILRISGSAARFWPLLPVPQAVLPNKFHVVARMIGANLPETPAFWLELSDFEVV